MYGKYRKKSKKRPAPPPQPAAPSQPRLPDGYVDLGAYGQAVANATRDAIAQQAERDIVVRDAVVADRARADLLLELAQAGLLARPGRKRRRIERDISGFIVGIVEEDDEA